MRTALAVVFLAGCAAEEYDVHTMMQVPDPAMAAEDTTFRFHITDSEGENVDDGDVTMVPWMPEHDHGIGEDIELVFDAAGIYETTFAFTMAGDWELRFDVEGSAVVIPITVDGDEMDMGDGTGHGGH